jgi:hypothetical protein
MWHIQGDDEDAGGSGTSGFIDAFVDPSCFRKLDTFIQSVDGGVLEVKDTSVQIQREGK